MFVFIIFVFVISLIVFASISNKRKTNKESKQKKQNIPIAINYELKNYEPERYSGSIQATVDGWCLNPGTPFELTVLQTTRDIAQSIRELCDKGYNDDTEQQLLSIFVLNNITIKEIEEYKDKYRLTYNNRLCQLIADCKEFDQMGVKDRDVLMKSFRTQAMDSIYELPNIDIENLFEEHDLTIDDNLVNQYGFDSINVYLSYFNKVGCVISVSHDAYYRNVFEQLPQKGLAIQGKNIPIKDVLTSQTLKTLNQIADNPEKIFKRKDQAIEYILSKDEKIARIEDFVAFSELFELIPLKDLSEKDATQISSLWEYYRTEIRLLLHTFSHSIYMWEKLNDGDQENRMRLYSSCSVSSTNDRCRCAQERMKTKYPLDKVPKTPCHIGCFCWITYNRQVHECAGR